MKQKYKLNSFWHNCVISPFIWKTLQSKICFSFFISLLFSNHNGLPVYSLCSRFMLAVLAHLFVIGLVKWWFCFCVVYLTMWPENESDFSSIEMVFIVYLIFWGFQMSWSPSPLAMKLNNWLKLKFLLKCIKMRSILSQNSITPPLPRLFFFTDSLNCKLKIYIFEIISDNLFLKIKKESL